MYELRQSVPGSTGSYSLYKRNELKQNRVNRLIEIGLVLGDVHEKGNLPVNFGRVMRGERLGHERMDMS